MKHSSAPSPSYLRSIQSDTWTMRGALSELIDNSFGPGRGNADNVWIAHDKTHRIISILDDGVGMDAVYSLFKLGAGIGRSHGDIGHYGAGGTRAIIWIPRVVQIWTMRDGNVSSYKMDWRKQIAAADFFEIPDRWVRADPDNPNVPLELYDLGHGTMISMQIGEGRQFQVPPLISELAQTYAPGLRSGKRLTWQTIQKDKPISSTALTDATPINETQGTIEFDQTIEFDGHALPLRGRITLSDVPFSKSEIAVGFGYRVISRARDCYSSPDGKESFHGSGVSGWVDVGEGWQPYLSTTKDSFHHADAWSALMGFVFEQIRPLLEKTERASQRMIFDEIAISLTAALNANTSLKLDCPDKAESPIDVAEADDECEDAEPAIDADDAGQDEKSPRERESEDRLDEICPAVTNIEIIQMTDHEMEGVLCKVDSTGTHIRALVNAEHESIQEALRAKPTNRQALVLYITHQLAAAIVDDPGLLRKTFRPKVVSLIEQRTGRHREQYVFRILMDRVRWPMAA